MKPLFTILSLLFIQNVQADSIWHCVDEDTIDDNSALIIHTGTNNTATVFGRDGVQLFKVRFVSNGMNDDQTIYTYVYQQDNILLQFLRAKNENTAAFSVSDLDLGTTRMWMCK